MVHDTNDKMIENKTIINPPTQSLGVNYLTAATSSAVRAALGEKPGQCLAPS